MEMSPTGDMCYTGGHDGVICCWSIPSINSEIYDPFGEPISFNALDFGLNLFFSQCF